MGVLSKGEPEKVLTLSEAVLARFCPPGRNRAAEILSARAAEIPFALSFSPMGRNCLVVHVYRIVLCFSSRYFLHFAISYQLVDPSVGLCTVNGQRR